MPLKGTLKENYDRMVNPSLQVNETTFGDTLYKNAAKFSREQDDSDYDPRFDSDPAIVEVAEKLANEISIKINAEAAHFPNTGATRYAAQNILEEVIKILESRV